MHASPLPPRASGRCSSLHPEPLHTAVCMGLTLGLLACNLVFACEPCHVRLASVFPAAFAACSLHIAWRLAALRGAGLVIVCYDPPHAGQPADPKA